MNWQDFRLSTRLQLSSPAIEQAYSLIAKIDAVKNSWHITGKLQPQAIEQLTHSVIVTSTGASNRIEGNRLTDAQIEKLYQNLHIKKFKTRDEQEVAGYLTSLESILENYHDITLTESTILQLHDNMLVHSEKDMRHKGNYKFGSNRVEAKDQSGNLVGVIFDPTPPHLVKKEMLELIDWFNWARTETDKHPLILIANFIFEFLAIHPFQDGNGRTSRLLTNLLLLQNDYLFTSLVSHERIIEQNKADYYLALNKTQTTWKTKTENITNWLIFFLNVIQTQSEKALALIENQSNHHLLSEKQTAFLQWAISIKKSFSRRDAIAALNYKPRTTEEILKKLVQLNFLQIQGQGRATTYKVINPN